MASSWTDLAQQMTEMYSQANNKKTANDFRNRHGQNGEGEDPNTIPYKFGRFVDRMKKLNSSDDVFTDRQRAQFLMDAGTRRWDQQSLTDIETVVKHSMTRNDKTTNSAAPKEIIFNIDADPTANKARAEVYDADTNVKAGRDGQGNIDVDKVTKFRIRIICPPL